MSTKESSEALIRRVRQLERQLVEVRRQLAPDRDALPATDLDLLEVMVGDITYALAIAPIVTVLPMVWPQPLPESPSWVLGTFQYGGEVVPLIDLHARLTGLRCEFDISWKIVLVRHRVLVGFVVTGVGEVMRAPASLLLPPSVDIPQAPFLRAALTEAEGGTIHLLSTDRLSRDFILEE